jgi:hypothetical protein
MDEPEEYQPVPFVEFALLGMLFWAIVAFIVAIADCYYRVPK